MVGLASSAAVVVPLELGLDDPADVLYGPDAVTVDGAVVGVPHGDAGVEEETCAVEVVEAVAGDELEVVTVAVEPLGVHWSVYAAGNLVAMRFDADLPCTAASAGEVGVDRRTELAAGEAGCVLALEGYRWQVEACTHIH